MAARIDGGLNPGADGASKAQDVARSRQHDRDLIARAADGDMRAFEELVGRHQRRAHTVAYGIVRSAEDAREVTQDAFLRVHRHLKDFEGGASFSTWLYRIVYNLSIDLIRRRSPGRAIELEDHTDLTGAPDEWLPARGELDPFASLDLAQDDRRAVVRGQLIEAPLHGLDEAGAVERLLAPWAIASLRLAMLLEETGFAGQVDTPIMILGDTLADADALARPISVVLGNPPYGREAPGSLGGGWIRGRRGAEQRAPLADFIEPARAAGAGAHVKNLYNLYVYFWRWACWQVFERRPQAPGVVAMVTAASFLRGPGFAGMRAHMRGCCSQVWLLDLEGDQRGAVASDNVFAISVPVAATVLVREGLSQKPGDVQRHRATGSRADKLALCARTRSLADLTWTRVGDSSGAAWTGGEDEAFHAWPRLVDLFPWQHSGAQWKRTWPVATEPGVLARRWEALLGAPDRRVVFRETRDRSVQGRSPPLRSPGMDLSEAPGEPIAAATRQPPVRRYGFRALDRRWCLADARLGDFLRPALWWVAGPRQVYLASLLTGALGPGPAAMVSAEVPDLHYFCGRGGKDIIPLWRDPEGRRANLGAGAMAALRGWYGPELRAEDVFAYAYALLAGSGYTRRFAVALQGGGPRLPLLRDRVRWREIAALGHRLIALHCFGERWLGEGPKPAPARGRARCLQEPEAQPDAVRHVDDALQLWRGEVRVGVFAPVPAAVWEHSLSGHAPVPAWVAARLQGGAGRRSSPLDAIQAERWSAATSEELLGLLWTVEATLALAPALADALAAACAGPSWRAEELPRPDAAERREPAADR